MKKIIFILLALIAFSATAKDYSVSSPSKKLTATVSVTDKVTYSVLLNGNLIISPSIISLKINDMMDADNYHCTSGFNLRL